MTTTDTAPDTIGIDYANLESAIGLNWYDIDPNLQQLVERLAAPADRPYVEQQLRNILEKLHLRNRQQAAAFAISSGLVRPQQEYQAPRPAMTPSYSVSRR